MGDSSAFIVVWMRVENGRVRVASGEWGECMVFMYKLEKRVVCEHICNHCVRTNKPAHASSTNKEYTQQASYETSMYPEH